jgi:hypothetical protein
MGAWGAETFANDDAMDWVAELEAAPDLRVLRAALDAAAEDDGEYLDAPVGSVALAAAEVVAALRGRPAAELPEEVGGWVAAHRAAPEAELVGLAARAVDAVAGEPSRSELRALWDEAAPEDRDAWRAGVADLRRRLT